MYVRGDNPSTQPVEGGVDGDSVKFRIVTINQDSLYAKETALWKSEINQQIDLNVITDFTDIEEEPLIQVLVNNKILGEDFFNGDPVFKNSEIQIKISNHHNGIDVDKTQIILNQQILDKTLYSIFPAENDPLYEYTILYKLTNLPNDSYDITINIYDFNNQTKIASTNFSFELFSSLTLKKVLNFPNPVQGSTSFTYYLVNQEPAEVKIKIYTVAGRLIKVIDYAPGDIGYNQIYWDSRDEDYNELANGVYFYKILAQSGNELFEVIERLVVMR